MASNVCLRLDTYRTIKNFVSNTTLSSDSCWLAVRPYGQGSCKLSILAESYCGIEQRAELLCKNVSAQEAQAFVRRFF